MKNTFLLFYSRKPQTQRHLKSEYALPQTLSRLFHLVQFVKCWWIFLELNSKGLYQSSLRKRKGKLLSFVPVLNKTWNEALSHCSRATTAKKCTKKQDASAKLLFCQSNPLAFCRPHCRRRWLSFLLTQRTRQAVTQPLLARVPRSLIKEKNKGTCIGLVPPCVAGGITCFLVTFLAATRSVRGEAAREFNLTCYQSSRGSAPKKLQQ